MNIDELRSVQDAERRNSGLQHLRDSFYEEAGTYIADLKAERQRVAERADDPWSSPEVGRLSDEIETAEEVVEAIYERRMGKLLSQASLAAADMGADEEGLTAEERELFHDVVDRIRANKTRVLDTVSGEGAGSEDAGPHDGAARSEPVPADGAEDPGRGSADRSEAGDAGRPPAGRSESEGTPGDRDPETPRDPAEATGAAGTTDSTNAERREVEPGSPPPDGGRPDTDGGSDPAGGSVSAAGAMGGGPASESAGADAGSGGDSPPEPPSPDEFADEGAGPTPEAAPPESGDLPSMDDIDDRVTVRITDDVGAIYGVDDREYDLERETVVQIPEENARPLIDRGAAERLD